MLQRWTRVAVLAGVLALFASMAVLSQAQEGSTPRVWSIVSTPTDGPMVSFTVTFSEPVSGVDAGDFRVLGSETAHIQQVQPTDNADVYTVTVSHDNSAADIVVMLVDDDSIRSASDAPLGGVGAQNGNFSSIVTKMSGASTLAQRPVMAPSTSPRTPSRVFGSVSSLKLTSTGIPVIAYNDETNADLKLAVCDTLLCTHPTITTIATTNVLAFSLSMSMTANDTPVIAYSENLTGGYNTDLRLAVCNDTICSNPTFSTLDSRPDGVGFISMALNSADAPVVSYHDYFTGYLKLAVCNNTACTSKTVMVLDDSATVGQYSSIALTATNNPIVSYYDVTNGDLKLAVCADPMCSTKTLSTLASAGTVGRYTSLAVTASNIPVISFFDDDANDLKLAVCDTTACATPVISTIDSTGIVGFLTSIVLNSAGAPVISYLDQTNEALKIAVCNNTACTSPVLSTLEKYAGLLPGSLALTAENRPIVSYSDYTSGVFKYTLGPVIIDLGQPNSFVKTAPGTPTITSTSVVLAWNAAVGATSYEYCIALSAVACTIWNSTGTATLHTVTDLVHGATYYWQVRARNDVGTTLANSSALWQFTVTLPPTSFAKTAPANNATNQKTSLVLSWAASTRATSYEYCVALTTATCTKWKSTGSARTATVSGLLKGKSYYWQVRAVNSGGSTSSASTFWKFTTAK